MQTIYFCLEHSEPLLRYSASTPQVGDTVVIPELGEKLGTLKVIDVVWEFDAVPHVNVHLQQTQVPPSKRRHSRWLRTMTPPFVLALIARFQLGRCVCCPMCGVNLTAPPADRSCVCAATRRANKEIPGC